MPNSNFSLTTKLRGRLGNQMFQIAHVYSCSLLFKRKWAIPKFESNFIEYENTIFKNVPTFNGSTEDIINSEIVKIPFHYQPTPAPSELKITIYDGWRQSEQFFQQHTLEIKTLFCPTESFKNYAQNMFPELKTKRICAIHIRRGDYLALPNKFPVITKEVILKGVKKLKIQPDLFFVLSDDIQWCKTNLSSLNNAKFIEWCDVDSLWLMSLCHDFIISNSSFSWWGSYLSNCSNKQIIAPSSWFGPIAINSNETPKDIIGKSWTLIPTVWKSDGLMHLI